MIQSSFILLKRERRENDLLNAIRNFASVAYRVLPIKLREGDEAALDDARRKALPTNVSALTLNGLFFPAAGKIASVGLLLTWFVNDLTPAAWVVGLIIPLQYGLSLLGQPLFAHWLSTRKRRVPLYAWQSAVRVIAWSTLAVATWTLGKDHARLLLTAFFVLIAVDSLAAGLGNIVFSDVLARLIPPGLRGRTRSWRGILGAITGGLAGFLMIRYITDQSGLPAFAWLFVVVGALYALGGAAFALADEQDNASLDGQPGIRALFRQLREVLSDAGFRRFIIVQALLVPLMQGLAFFTLLGRREFGLQFSALGVLIMADALAPLLGNIVFGRLADARNNRSVMVWAASAGLIAPMVGGLLIWKGHHFAHWPVVTLFATVVFAIGFGMTGLDLATKNYVLGFSDDEKKRPMYIGTSDMLVGLPTMLLAIAGLMIDRTGLKGFAGVYIMMTLLTLTAIVLTFTLPTKKA